MATQTFGILLRHPSDGLLRHPTVGQVLRHDDRNAGGLVVARVELAAEGASLQGSAAAHSSEGC